MKTKNHNQKRTNIEPGTFNIQSHSLTTTPQSFDAREMASFIK